MIRVMLPPHLRKLAKVDGEVHLELPAPVTMRAVVEALEERFPTLRGTIREHGSDRRRPLVRFFACEQDLSHEPLDHVLPDSVAAGTEPFLIIGAMAGG